MRFTLMYDRVGVFNVFCSTSQTFPPVLSLTVFFWPDDSLPASILFGSLSCRSLLQATGLQDENGHAPESKIP